MGPLTTNLLTTLTTDSDIYVSYINPLIVYNASGKMSGLQYNSTCCVSNKSISSFSDLNFYSFHWKHFVLQAWKMVYKKVLSLYSKMISVVTVTAPTTWLPPYVNLCNCRPKVKRPCLKYPSQQHIWIRFSLSIHRPFRDLSMNFLSVTFKMLIVVSHNQRWIVLNGIYCI